MAVGRGRMGAELCGSEALGKASFTENWEECISTEPRLPSKEWHSRASLMAQWLRIRLPMQETWVRALVWEDPTCRGATRPVSHNY